MRRLLFTILFISSVVASGLSSPLYDGPADQQPRSGAQPEIISKLEGTVEVSFMIDAKGKVKILSMDASNEQLAQYVIKKLNKISLDKPVVDSGKVIKYRFVFKKQA